MPAFSKLVVRDDASAATTMSPTMMKLLIALVVLTLLGLFLGVVLYLLRAVRRSRERKAAAAGEGFGYNPQSNNDYRRLTIDIHNSQSSYVAQEKRSLIENSNSPPPSPLPEIRITFPDELDKQGRTRPQSGRVVVVRMGENSVYGLEPLNEPAPPYQPREGQRFQSLDLDRMGGLKEKQYA